MFCLHYNDASLIVNIFINDGNDISQNFGRDPTTHLSSDPLSRRTVGKPTHDLQCFWRLNVCEIEKTSSLTLRITYYCDSSADLCSIIIIIIISTSRYSWDGACSAFKDPLIQSSLPGSANKSVFSTFILPDVFRHSWIRQSQSSLTGLEYIVQVNDWQCSYILQSANLEHISLLLRMPILTFIFYFSIHSSRP